jgi:hypothetical protein
VGGREGETGRERTRALAALHKREYVRG